MSFCIKNDKVWDKYDKIWEVTKNKLNIKFHSKPVYEYKFLEVKVREFNCVIKTNFLNNGVPKDNIHYSESSSFNHLQVYSDLESHSDLDSDNKQLMTKLNKSDIDLDCHSDSEVESKSNAKLMAKLKKINSDKN